VKYTVVVEGRKFEIEVTSAGQVWVDREPVDVDLENVDGLPLYSLLVDHRSFEAHLENGNDGECLVAVAGRAYHTSVQAEQRPAARAAPSGAPDGPAEVTAPLPGLVVRMEVREGQAVERGTVVAVLESMKMHLELRAPRSGQVRAVPGVPGREVAQGEALVVIG
jgi:biotin carboxyl carrier protein